MGSGAEGPSLIRHQFREKAAVPQGSAAFLSWNAGNAPEQAHWASKARERFRCGRFSGSGGYTPLLPSVDSLHSVPDAAPTAVLLQMSAFDQIAEVQLQGVAIAACQLDRLGHRDAPMLAGKLHDLQGQRR